VIKIKIGAIFALVMCVPVASHAYEFSTHAFMTDKALARSILGAADSPTHPIRRLGFVDGPSANLRDRYFDIDAFGSIRVRFSTQFELTKFKLLDDQLSVNPPTLSTNNTAIRGWLARGAIREDDVPFDGDNLDDNTPQDEPGGNFARVFAHFYDPRLDRGLTKSVPNNQFVTLGPKAMDWAVTAGSTIPSIPSISPVNGFNHYKISDAREAMWRALTLTARQSGGTYAPIDTTVLVPTFSGASFISFTQEQFRLAYWAAAFRALGDATHLIQDMAQPQHTRNDLHSGKGCVFGDCVGGHASFYEAYIEARVKKELRFRVQEGILTKTDIADPQPVPATDVAQDTYPAVNFNSYIAFFGSGTGPNVDTGPGLAQYSNRGFYTFGTNIRTVDGASYPAPPPDFPAPGLFRPGQERRGGPERRPIACSDHLHRGLGERYRVQHC
jgi:hypothetical protein